MHKQLDLFTLNATQNYRPQAHSILDLGRVSCYKIIGLLNTPVSLIIGLEGIQGLYIHSQLIY